MRGLYFAASAMMAGVSSVFALLAEIEHRYGLGPGSLGWIAGTAFLAALCTQLGLARYADRGHGALLLRVGIAACVVGLLWFAAATELWQFIAARALLGASVGIVVPAARRAIVMASGADLGRRLGTFYAAYLSGFVFGPPLAGALTTLADVRLPFVVLGLIVAVSAVSLRGLQVDGAPEAEPGEAATSSGVLRRLLRSRKMIAALLVIMAFRYSVGAFEPMWAVFFDDLGASTMLITISMTLFALPMLVIARWSGGVTDRNGARFVSVAAAAFTAPLMASYGFIGIIPVIIALAMVHGVMEALLNPGSQVAIAEAAPKRDAAAAQGLAEAAGSVMAGLGAFAAAPSLAAWGAQWAWAAAGGVMAVLLALSYVLDPPRRVRHARPSAA